MSLSLIQLYGSVTGGTENALATVDVPEDGEIVAIDWAVNADLDADGESLSAEVSFIATNTNNINDARGMISVIRGQISLTTSGAPVVAINKFVTFPEALQVSGGERLYLHTVSTAGVNASINAIIHLSTRRPSVRRSRRRT